MSTNNKRNCSRRSVFGTYLWI